MDDQTLITEILSGGVPVTALAAVAWTWARKWLKTIESIRNDLDELMDEAKHAPARREALFARLSQQDLLAADATSQIANIGHDVDRNARAIHAIGQHVGIPGLVFDADTRPIN